MRFPRKSAVNAGLGLAGLALVLAVPASADTQSVFHLYAQGKYDESIAAGLAMNNAAGFADAARAALAEEASGDKRCLECLEKAEDYSRHAIADDPKMPDGHIYLAISLGLQGRIEGTLVAKLKGYPDEAKRALDTALKSDPKNPWALAGLGGWNIEVVRGGGSALARWIYGASVEKGLHYFDEAFAAAPDNITIRYQYALTLSGYDTERFHDRIEGALDYVVNGTVDTAYGHLLQKRAAMLLDLLKKDDTDAFDKRVRTYEGYMP